MSAPEQLHLRMLPRPTRSVDSPAGLVGITVGTGDGEVVVTLTPAAADQLGRVIAASPRLVDGSVDQNVWIDTFIDLMSAAAFVDDPPRIAKLVVAGVAR